jgi:hypothetical protein
MRTETPLISGIAIRPDRRLVTVLTELSELIVNTNKIYINSVMYNSCFRRYRKSVTLRVGTGTDRRIRGGDKAKKKKMIIKKKKEEKGGGENVGGKKEEKKE